MGEGWAPGGLSMTLTRRSSDKPGRKWLHRASNNGRKIWNRYEQAKLLPIMILPACVVL